MNSATIDFGGSDYSSHFSVRFPPNVEMIRDMHTIPSRQFDCQDDDYRYIVKLAGSAHLMAFADKWGVENIPQELIDDAAKCPNDGLEKLPPFEHFLDYVFDGDKFVARYPIQQIGSTGSSRLHANIRINNLIKSLNSNAEFSQRLKYWTIPFGGYDLLGGDVEERIKGKIKSGMKRIVKEFDFGLSKSATRILFPGWQEPSSDDGESIPGLSKFPIVVSYKGKRAEAVVEAGFAKDMFYASRILNMSILPTGSSEKICVRWMAGFAERTADLKQRESVAVENTNKAYERHCRKEAEKNNG